ncbi:Sodium-coupled monocarboxylate transporter 1 [Eumeta japonica]|uniref:Sodium-coupled monocarboxylate transporter 1 n=1 Tax=Eumeta variegata TaxID=151549 RepID=A0A4C1UVF5_EUMVA|nr:Sodium-coupled monocarboxylate transporter 1 [Eumeta japonica]
MAPTPTLLRADSDLARDSDAIGTRTKGAVAGTIFVTIVITTAPTVKSAPNVSEDKPTAPNNINDSFRNGTFPSEFFHWEDYCVLAAMLIISCLLGIFYGYFGEKQTTSDDFLLGGSTMGTFPMALSLAASFVTAIELLGNPTEMYLSGAQFWMICVAFLLVVPIASYLFLPVFMKLRLTSCYEYLEIRFCKTVRMYACILYMLQMTLYTAVAVYAPALALSDVTGLNTYLAVSLVYVVCIFYASQGGMKAVIMTDTFQSGVLIGSLVVVLALGAERLGGLPVAWDYANKTDRLHFFEYGVNKINIAKHEITIQYNTRNSAAVKLITKATRWLKLGTRGRRKKGRGASNLRITSFAGNSERQKFMYCSILSIKDLNSNLLFKSFPKISITLKIMIVLNGS